MAVELIRLVVGASVYRHHFVDRVREADDALCQRLDGKACSSSLLVASDPLGGGNSLRQPLPTNRMIPSDPGVERRVAQSAAFTVADRELAAELSAHPLWLARRSVIRGAPLFDLSIAMKSPIFDKLFVTRVVHDHVHPPPVEIRPPTKGDRAA